MSARHWQRPGIGSVPSLIIDEQHLIHGRQWIEVFERALRRLGAGQVA